MIPYCLWMHVVFAIYMYGNGSIFPVDEFSSQPSEEALSAAADTLNFRAKLGVQVWHIVGASCSFILTCGFPANEPLLFCLDRIARHGSTGSFKERDRGLKRALLVVNPCHGFLVQSPHYLIASFMQTERD